MANEINLDEFIKNYYKKRYYGDEPVKLDRKVLTAFSKEYRIIEELKKLYEKGEVNRKVVGEEITKRMKTLKELLEIFERDLCESDYRYPEYITDYKKTMQLLLRLANESNDNYCLKAFSSEQLGSLETQHGDRETGLFIGATLVIGEKEVLDKIDNSKPYYGEELGSILTKVVENNHSLAVITDYYYESNVMPFTFYLKSNNHSFHVKGTFSDLCSYTYDDDLGNAIDKLKSYIDTYGGNIENVSIDTIVSRINGLDIDKDVLKKVKE